MFTRTNICLSILLFLLFFIILMAIFGEHGILVERQLYEKNIRLEDSVEMKKAQIKLLREKNTIDQSLEGELLLYLPDQPYVPDINTSNKSDGEYKGLSSLAIVLISVFPSLLYLFICYIIRIRRR